VWSGPRADLLQGVNRGGGGALTNAGSRVCPYARTYERRLSLSSSGELGEGGTLHAALRPRGLPLEGPRGSKLHRHGNLALTFTLTPHSHTWRVMSGGLVQQGLVCGVTRSVGMWRRCVQQA